MLCLIQPVISEKWPEKSCCLSPLWNRAASTPGKCGAAYKDLMSRVAGGCFYNIVSLKLTASYQLFKTLIQHLCRIPGASKFLEV